MILSEHKGQAKRIFHLSAGQLQKKYKGSFFGPVWAIIKPSFTLFILWFAFAVGLRGNGSVNGFPRFFFMLTGYIPWFFIQEAILTGTKSIRANRQYVTKLSFPMSNIMTFNNLSVLYVHFILCVIMYVILIIAGYCPSIYNLEFFYYCPMMFIFFLVLTWTTAPMAAFSVDFENLVNSIMTGLFWLSGIVWNTYDMDKPWLKKLMYLNPINYFINGYRRAFLYNEPILSGEGALETKIMAAELIFLILLGSHFYKKLRKLIPDVL